ncbi:STAS/SEC14 domain-containing protein [candidate division WOR-3 bacterium]|nr:STAS/SEC14 domain-containing protein [candidate division WOR-3 bacterium]
MKEIITFEEPDIVVLTLRGKLVAEEMEDMFERWGERYGQKKKVRVLVDCSELEEIPPKAREVLRKGGLKYPISRLSTFGASTKIRIMAGLIVKMVPTVDDSIFVKTEEEARVWLNQGK